MSEAEIRNFIRVAILVYRGMCQMNRDYGRADESDYWLNEVKLSDLIIETFLSQLGFVPEKIEAPK